MTRPLRIHVEESRCEGHGLCVDVAPEVFDLDDAGEVTLLHQPVPAELEARAEAGARACPVAALTIGRLPSHHPSRSEEN